MLVVAWGAVWPAAGSEFDFALVEVSFELGPFFVGDRPILSFRSFSASICEPLLIMLDDVLFEDGLWRRGILQLSECPFLSGWFGG
jgi:hypothetical protein